MIVQSKLVVLAFSLTILQVTSNQAATFMPLGSLPGGNDFSQGHGISPDGSTVVGLSTSALGTDQNTVAFRWDKINGMQNLGSLSPSNVNSRSLASSLSGDVIVGHSRSPQGNEAFIWTETNGLQGLGDLSSAPFHSSANGISGDGSIVVGGSISSQEAFEWRSSTGMQGLGFLPGGSTSIAAAISFDGQVIVGSANQNGGFGQAVMWDADRNPITLGDLPGGSNEGNAIDVSNDGSVIVGWVQSSNGVEAFRWDDQNGMIGLGTLGSHSFASAVSGDGTVIVGSSLPSGGNDVFIWNETDGMQSLTEILTNAGNDLSGWELVDANGISDDGTRISGYGINPLGKNEAWLIDLSTNVIPEPTTLFLTLVALISFSSNRFVG